MMPEIRGKILKLCLYCVSFNNKIHCSGKFDHFVSVSRICTSIINSRKTLTSVEALRHNNNRLQNEKDDGDIFGNIENFDVRFDSIKDDAEDIKEYKRSKSALGKSMGYYVNEILKLLKNNEYKKALNLLEEEMAKDRKPLNDYVYRLFFSYNAKTGNIQESYRLYTNYKKKNGLVTGAMYTSLFNACANSRNSFLALEKAEKIREYMKNDKNHSVNLSNYNAMLKAYGRHGDLPTCLKIVDEVLERRDKVKTETYCFLLQACASDRNSGLRHALITWRKMLQNRCVPTIYEFNTLLRCVRDCFLGDVELVNDFVKSLELESNVFFKRKVLIYRKNGVKKRKILKIPVSNNEPIKLLLNNNTDKKYSLTDVSDESNIDDNTKNSDTMLPNCENDSLVSEIQHFENNKDFDRITLIKISEEDNKSVANNTLTINNNNNNDDDDDDDNSHNNNNSDINNRNNNEILDFLSLTPAVGPVIRFGSMTQPYERLLCVGGLKGFLKTMNEFGVEPNIKTFTLLLDVVPQNQEAEEEVIAEAKARNVKLDTTFFNVLIKKRIFRKDDFSFQEILKDMQLAEVSPDIITFGVLAIGCSTHESGIELIKAVRQGGFRLNSEILGGLLQSADKAKDMHYVKTILDAAKEDQISLNPKFIGTLGRVVKKEKQRRLAKKENFEKEVKDLQLSAS